MRSLQAWRLLPLMMLLHPPPSSARAAVESSTSPVSASQPQGDPAVFFRTGKSALAAGRLAEAESAFRSVIALDSHSAAAHVNLAVAYMRERRWDDALGELRTAQALAPHEAGIQRNIGLTYYRENDFTAAISPFSEALRLQPDSIQSRYLLGLCYFFVNRYREAADTLAPLWTQQASNLNYLYVLSIAASKAKDAALQKQAFDQMLKIGQNTPEFHLYLGKAWLAQDATDKALAEFKAAATARPKMPLAHYFLGRTYLVQHAYQQAKTEFEADVALEPAFAYNYEELGILYAQLNQPTEAEHSFQQAVERNSSLVNAWFGLAKLYRDTGQYPEALTMLDRAETLAPTSASVHYTRGQVLMKLGKRTEAQKEFARTAELHKSFNDRLLQDPLGEHSADAQNAAEE